MLSSMLLLTALTITTPQTNPVEPARSDVPTISNEDLFGKSLVAAQQTLDHYGSWDEDDAQRRVADIGYRLAGQTAYRDFPLTFSVVDMREPNAFALPGGQIFVTRGMLDLGLSDDQLAGLLGHEISHVTLAHGTKMQKRARLLNALSQAAMVGIIVASDSIGGERAPEGVPIGRNPGETSAGARIQGALAATMILGELLMRGYSREFEDQADAEGQRMSAAAGFDPVGAADLFDLMDSRLPQTREYGYWRTHPFFTDRIVAARARGRQIATLDAKPVDAFRQATQKTLLDFDTEVLRQAEDETKEAARRFLEAAALEAWPSGPDAETIRQGFLDQLRERFLVGPEIGRDYGHLLRQYQRQRAEVADLTPESDYLADLDRAIGELEVKKNSNYPEAQRILSEGIYQTEFLETFLSNYPEAPEFPSAAIALATSYARVRRTRESVEFYLEAWKAAPLSDLGQRSRQGLEFTTPDLNDLTALGLIVDSAESISDPKAREEARVLERLAEKRLSELAPTFEDLENGAEYLQQFPDGDAAEAVAKRLDEQAEKLYGEVILYQGIGDSLKALDRIRDILTHAPLSEAARRLGERAVMSEN